MKETTERVRALLASEAAFEIARDAFAGTPLILGAHVQRRQHIIGRVEGYQLVFRKRPEARPGLMTLGPDLLVEAVAEVRVAARSSGRMVWSRAPQRVSRMDVHEWIAADPRAVNSLLRAMEAAAKRVDLATPAGNDDFFADQAWNN